MLFCLILLAHGASSSGSPQPGVAGSAIRVRVTVRHGPERQGRPISRGASAPRVCGRLPFGATPEPCRENVHGTRRQAAISQVLVLLDRRKDHESGTAGGPHRNRDRGPGLPQPAAQLHRPLALVWPNINAVSASRVRWRRPSPSIFATANLVLS